MRTLPLAALALLLTTTATMPAGARHASDLTRGRECIDLGAIRTETAETDDSLIFHAGGDTAYRSQLPASCDHLLRINNVDKLKLHPRGDRLCRGDTVEVIDHDSIIGGLAGNGEQAITCKLGGFEGISEMSLSEQLRR